MENLSDELKKQFKQFQASDSYVKMIQLCRDINNDKYINKKRLMDVLFEFMSYNDRYISKLLKIAILANHNSAITQHVLNIHEQELEQINKLIDKTNEVREQSETSPQRTVREEEEQDKQAGGLPF